MLAIFYTEIEAVKFSEDIHTYLKKNRPGYNAVKWSDVNKADKEDKWMVKVPHDYQRWPVKLAIPITVKEQIPIADARVYLKDWYPVEIEPIIIKK